MKRSPLVYVAGAIGFIFVAGFMFLLGSGGFEWDGVKRFRKAFASGSNAPAGRYSGTEEEDAAKAREEAQKEELSDTVVDRIKSKLQDLVVDLSEGKNRDKQTILGFKTDAEYQEFLKKIKGTDMAVLNKNANLRSVLLSTPSLNNLRDFLGANPGLDPSLQANPTLQPPTALDSKDPNSSGNDAAFSQNGVAAALGANKVNANSGKGVVVAILDSAVANIGIFGNQLVVANSAIKEPTTDLSHGTSVASLVKMFAPGATLHSYPVVAADGMSDSFTISDAIIQSVNDGANIINISLGSYSENSTLAEAVAYAKSKGVQITASAGNEGLNNSTYPARYAGVAAALAGDADGMPATFSNTSSNFGYVLPGVGVPIIHPDGQMYAGDGTSFSSPMMAALLANVMADYSVSAGDALQMLQSTANDAGAPGPDPVNGYGWPRLDDVANSRIPGYTDGRIASNYLDNSNPQALTMDYVVQNNGSTDMVGWNLNVSTNGEGASVRIPNLSPNQSWSYAVPFQMGADTLSFSSQLNAPAGVSEVNSANNALHTTLTPKSK